MFSTLGDIIEYTGGCSVHGRDIKSTPGVFSTVGDTMSTQGDTMMSVGYIMSTAGVFSTPGDTMRKLGGYHDECGGISVNWGFHTIQLLSQ